MRAKQIRQATAGARNARAVRKLLAEERRSGYGRRPPRPTTPTVTDGPTSPAAGR
jgi:hypothetical protein